MLDILHDREFYLEKAEEYPLLQDIVSGETTFESHLDELLDRMEQDSSLFKKKKESPHLEDFKGYVELLAELSWHYVSKQSAQKNAEAIVNYKRNMLVLGGSGLATVGALALLFIPPFNVLEYVFYYFGLFKTVDSIPSALKALRVRKNRKVAFDPLYSIAVDVDDRIGQLFVREYFDTSPKRFEQIYPKLTSYDREGVDEHLFKLLGAGGMKNMDEIQLKTYLSGLLEPEAEPGGDA